MEARELSAYARDPRNYLRTLQESANEEQQAKVEEKKQRTTKHPRK